MKKNVYIGLPCYNEEKDINTLIDRLLVVRDKVKKQFGYDTEIFCVNDGSTDSTQSIINKRKKDKIKLINHDGNKGLGGAMKTIIYNFNKLAKEGDFLIVMDADNSHNPEYVLDLIKKQESNNTDVVIASRYQKNATITGLKKYRIMISNLAKYWYTLMLRIPNVRDYTCGYRLYTYDIINKGIKEFGYDIITQTSFACMMELLYKLYLCGGSMSEIPFALEYGKKMGKSKMKVLKTTKDSLKTTIAIKRDKKKDHNLIEYIIILLLTIGLLGLSGSRLSNVGLVFDPAVYLNVARNILNGKILYTGIVDNKGPILYFINALFLKIGGQTGIVILEFILLFTTLLYIYKVLKMLNDNKFQRILLLIFGGVCLARFFTYGLSCEEYALCFSSIGLYQCIKYYKNDCFSKWQCVLLGILCALCFFIRQNLIAIFAGFAIGIAIKLIIEKKFKVLIQYIIYALTGFLMVVIPLLIYLFNNNCFHEYLEYTFLLNMSLNKLGYFKSLLTIYSFIPCSLLIIFINLIILVYKIVIKREIKELGIFFAIIITILFNIISAYFYGHYLISWIPIILISYNRLLNTEYKTNRIVLSALLIVISIIDIFNFKNNFNIPQPNGYIINYVKDNTNDSDKIAVIGFADEIYYLTEREAISRFTYILSNKAFSTEQQIKMLDEYFDDIMNGKPKIIVEFDETMELGVEPYIDITDYRKFTNDNYEKITFGQSVNIYKIKDGV